ncbi:hypothetical protein [Pseudorhodoplanes sp.]|uniref:hypothetical protein n=1 Tax=Pseudorhodoplanes sp. TaxID=1934341 RepID=UPI002CB30E46|nr:hypothetical protein [Pseudorhodoplanes sp.]HWV52999.1 hypothetical protein [Pseudorhodoplanes sp.]
MSCPSNIKATALALTALAVSCAVSGCSDIYFDRRETVVPYAGDAQAVNRATMMVDPWPPYAANRNIAFNGERMQGAVERYRTHNVIRPMSPLTSDSGSQPQPPPDLTTEQIRGVSVSRGGPPPPPQGSAPSPWAGPQKAQPQP